MQRDDRTAVGQTAGKSRRRYVDAVGLAGRYLPGISDAACESRLLDVDAGEACSDRAGNAVGNAARESQTVKVNSGVVRRIYGAGIGDPAGERRSVDIDAGVVRIDRASVDDAAVEARRIDLDAVGVGSDRTAVGDAADERRNAHINAQISGRIDRAAVGNPAGEIAAEQLHAGAVGGIDRARSTHPYKFRSRTN